jgi:putative ABC transport system permease protein
MELRESVEIAVANMLLTKVRSGLSILGLVIGTAAIIIVVAIANGSRKMVIESLSIGNADVLYIWPWYDEVSRRAGSLTLNDVDVLSRLPNVESATPEILETKEVGGPSGHHPLKGLGIDPGYLEVHRYRVFAGRDISLLDVRKRALVVVFTKDSADRLFQGPNPVGQSVRINGVYFEVVGVALKPAGGPAGAGVAKNADYFIPVSTLLYLEKNINIPSIRVRVAKGKSELALRSVKHYFGSDPVRKSLVKISDPNEFIEEIKKKDRALMLQLMSIAAVSLLVGGIGIMNVMLTSVAERTREIGLRKALGATSRDILEQFLVETSFLSGVGGILGTVLGLAVSWALPILSSGKVPTSPVLFSIVLSIGFSLTFGLFFGLFPASKAAQLSPIESLRYE